MNEKTKSIFYPIIIPLIIGAIFIGGWFLLPELRVDEPEEQTELKGRSGPDRDVFGARTNTTTVPITFFGDTDGSAIASSSAVLVLLQHTDEILLNVSTPNASSTSELYWNIWGSNIDNCDATATSTEDDTYVDGDPYVSDIPWFTITDTDSSGNLQNINTFGKNSATGTSYILADINWSCLRFEASGASSTLWMQIREKINTIN